MGVTDAESSATVGENWPEWVTLDVTESVRSFLENPSENYGWKISQDPVRGALREFQLLYSQAGGGHEADALGEARLVEVPAAGHLSTLEQPEAVTAAMLDRKQAICQIPNSLALTTAPPVENRSAATSTCHR